MHKVEAVVREEEGMAEERLELILLRLSGRGGLEALRGETIKLAAPLLLRRWVILPILSAAQAQAIVIAGSYCPYCPLGHTAHTARRAGAGNRVPGAAPPEDDRRTSRGICGARRHAKAQRDQQKQG